MQNSLRPVLLLVAATLLPVGAACGRLRTPHVLEQLNRTVAAKEMLPRVSDERRVARVVAERMVDAYFEPEVVGRWLDAMATDPRPIVAFMRCSDQSEVGGACHRRLSETIAPVAGASCWGLPTRPPSSLDPSQAEARREIDLQRFAANTFSLALHLREMRRGLARDDFEPSAGIRLGAMRAKRYLLARSWRRELERPPTALVLSGGAANGAFTAGAVWRLLSIIDGCKRRGQCRDFRIDLVTGTSTGALIGVAADLFFTPGRERQALELLLDRYTCSVEADLYCARDDWTWELVDDVRGLARFDGVARLLDEHLSQDSIDNQTELVAVTLKLEEGQIYTMSDQDPFTRGTREERIRSILSSIVVPVLAEPVDDLGAEPEHQGTFVDGGIRSVLPVLDAVDRGAARVLAFSNTTYDLGPRRRPRHAFDVLTGTLDIFAAAGLNEPQLAQTKVIVRRMQEYDLCRARLEQWFSPSGGASVEGLPSVTHDDAYGRRVFCERDFAAPRRDDDAASAGTSAGFPQVRSSFDVEWFHLPEGGLEEASGYAFDAAVMRPLFRAGVRLFQERCARSTHLIGLTDEYVQNECRRDPSSVIGELTLRPESECRRGTGELRLCE